METLSTVIIFALIVATGILLWILFREPHPDGQIVVVQDDDGKKKFSLELNMNPDDIERKKFITFKVTDHETEDFD